MEKNDDLAVFSEAADTTKERPSLKKEALGSLLDDETLEVSPRNQTSETKPIGR